MFDDKRGKRVVVLAHCLLNQNAKLDRCAHCAGAVTAVVRVLLDEGIGMLPMDCPEMLYLGLDREAAHEAGDAVRPSVAAEDTRIARRMAEPAAQAIIARIADCTARQIADYRRHHFSVIGILGINGSPSCGVETTWRDDVEPPGHGELIGALMHRLRALDVPVPARGIRSSDPAHAVETLRALIDASA